MRGPGIALTAAVGGILLVPASPLAGEPLTPPTAVLKASPTTVRAGATVRLDSSASRAGSGTIVGHVWDLDGNGSFELVFVDASSLTVTSIKDDSFVDIEGPKPCNAEVSLARDPRNGDMTRLVLNVPDGSVAESGGPCLAQGRHYFALDRDSLSELP